MKLSGSIDYDVKIVHDTFYVQIELRNQELSPLDSINSSEFSCTANLLHSPFL